VSLPRYTTSPHNAFERKFDNLPLNEREDVLKEIQNRLCVDPYNEAPLLGHPYRKAGMRKFRVGKNRIILVIQEPERVIHLLDFDNRGSVYRF